jgi:hypothetical protein
MAAVCSRRSSQKCQQNSANDAEENHIPKLPVDAVLPRFHSLHSHNRSMSQALACREGNEGAVRRGFSGSQQQKRRERDKPAQNIGSHSLFISRSHLECHKSVYSG